MIIKTKTNRIMKATNLRLKKITIVITIIILLPFLANAQWGPIRNITPNAMSAYVNENAYPCLAISGDTLHIVYADTRSQGNAIYYLNSHDAGVTWSNPVAITDTMGKTRMPSLAVLGYAIHVVWLDTVNGVKQSFYKQSLDGGITWSNNFCLDTNTVFWPGISVNGQMVVATLNKLVTPTNTEVFIMISLDNGATWGPEIQISNADGRSEDPAVALQSSQIHISWNDKRTGTMEIYYRRSLDAGATWGPETPLTNSDSYSSMVSIDGNHVDVPCGKTLNTHIEVYMNQSSDSGATFGASQQITHDSLGDAYPYLLRNGMDLYMVYMQFQVGHQSPFYLHSGDGGATWDSAISFGPGGQPFIVITDCALHLIFPDSGKIRYVVNSLCNTSGINQPNQSLQLLVYPNPSNAQTTIELLSDIPNDQVEIKIFNVLGEEVINTNFGKDQKIIINRNQVNSGIYFYRIIHNNEVIKSGKILFY